MSTRTEANTNLVNVSFDALVRQNLSSIDEKLGFVVDLDTVVSKRLHDLASFWALRLAAVDRASLLSLTREIHAPVHL